jgi:sec-independent protein translocase protein TatA
MYTFLLLDFVSPWHIILIVLVALLLFGGKRLKDSMRGLGEGIKEFKKAMKDEEEPKKETNTPVKEEDKAKTDPKNN